MEIETLSKHALDRDKQKKRKEKKRERKTNSKVGQQSIEL